ncbi:oligopeptide transporter 4-like [Gossypium australe]|uniref:Oligopeptide transporter 4-like n=1 Tax=Gossypium australe TaxID=47621 RepID=A0A5B6WHM3_9ROSI|nr:oligopeptide transporter 4-like [Gossypium australe]
MVTAMVRQRSSDKVVVVRWWLERKKLKGFRTKKRRKKIKMKEKRDPCINRPAVNANNFEIKPTMIEMIQSNLQFRGSTNEDPNQHRKWLLTIFNTFKYNGVPDDTIRL